MRTTFINKLIKKADKNTFFMVGDLGYSVVEPFIEKWPDQFLNAGIAEQNMTGMAAGLAIEGYKVFTYSIGNFNTIRCLEQIRNDICYHDLDVTIVSVGGGLTYGSAGYSHHAVQDIAILGSMPNMTLLLPGDPVEVEYCMDYIFSHQGPKYLRIGKNGEKKIHAHKKYIGNITNLNPETKGDIALVSVSTMLHKMIEVGKKLDKNNIKANLFSVSIIDKDFGTEVSKKLTGYKNIFTLEEHIENFGFGSLMKNKLENVKIKSFGLKKDLCKKVGDQEYLCQCHEINTEKILSKIIKNIKRNE